MIFDAAEMLYRTSLLDWPGLAPGLFLSDFLIILMSKFDLLQLARRGIPRVHAKGIPWLTG